jgi:hypothetical protein
LAKHGFEPFVLDRLLGSRATLREIGTSASRPLTGLVNHNMTIRCSDEPDHIALWMLGARADARSHGNMFGSTHLVPI